MASTTRNSKTQLKVGKKTIILVDRDDNQTNWLELLRKEIWENVYIPKNLRKKYKITYNAKEHVMTFKKKKKK